MWWNAAERPPTLLMLGLIERPEESLKLPDVFNIIPKPVRYSQSALKVKVSCGYPILPIACGYLNSNTCSTQFDGIRIGQFPRKGTSGVIAPEQLWYWSMLTIFDRYKMQHWHSLKLVMRMKSCLNSDEKISIINTCYGKQPKKYKRKKHKFLCKTFRWYENPFQSILSIPTKIVPLVTLKWNIYMLKSHFLNFHVTPFS